jgi:heme-degrading monooxygenase HmoA
MFARLPTLGGAPEQMDEALRHLRERIIPRIQQQDGYNGFISLGERETGEVIGISLWESERALQATEEEANSLRAETAEATGAAIASVESYEVPLLELYDWRVEKNSKTEG